MQFCSDGATDRQLWLCGNVLGGNQYPELDWSKIKFPSDRITIGKLRAIESKKFARAFDITRFACFPFNSLELKDLMRTERVIADKAYSKILGVPDNYLYEFWDDGEVDRLADRYREWGLCRGDFEAKELIRGIETAAAAEAKAVQGRSP